MGWDSESLIRPYGIGYTLKEGATETIPYTRELVSSQYHDAKEVARLAREDAEAFLDQLEGVLDFTIALDLATFERTPIDVNANFGERPESPDTDITMPPDPDQQDVSWQSSDDFQQLATDLKSWLHNQLTVGGRGLNEDVEDAIYNRARSRQETEREERHEERINYWAERGHTRPPGVLDKQLRVIDSAHDRNLTDINRDIVINQVKVEQEMLVNALEKSLVFGDLDLKEQIEKSRFLVDKYLKLVQAFQVRAQVAIEEKKAEASIYESEVRAYSAETDSEKTKILAQIEEAKAKIEERKTKAMVEVENAKLELQKKLSAFELDKILIDSRIKLANQIVASAYGTIQTDASSRYSFSLSNSHQQNRSASVSTQKSINFQTTFEK